MTFQQSASDSKTKPVHPEGDQSLKVFTEGLMLKLEAPGYFDFQLMLRANYWEKQMLGKTQQAKEGV